MNINEKNLILKKGNVFSVLKKLKSKFNIIFADPPYDSHIFSQLVDLIINYEVNKEGAILIYEHYKKTETPESYKVFHKVRDRIYGDSRISIFKQKSGEILW